MSTGGNFGRPWRRRNVLGATAIVALVVISLLTLGSASGRQVAQHRAGDASAAGSATSSTHVLSRAQGHASLVSRASGHAAQHSLSSSSSSRFPAFGPTSSAASRSLAAVNCGDPNTIARASGFEDADGNLAVNTAGCMDWNLFTPTWSGAPATNPPQTGTASNNGFSFVGATDRANSVLDNIYAGGVKQDTVCPGTAVGKANDKADLSAIYISGEKINGQVYLFLSWERTLDTTVNSDVFISFEFNQSKDSCGLLSPFVQRTEGDLLFQYNFQSGNSTIDVQQWDGVAWQPLTTPPFEASVNAGDVSDTIRPDQPVTLTQFEFGEAGINLSALDLSGNGGKACETFGSVLGGSRTSKSGDNAQLKDFVGPAPLDLSNCVQPSVTTTLKNAAVGNATIANGSSITLGSSVFDTATLGDLISGTPPTGKVQYTFFTNGDCTGDGTSAGLKTLNGDGSVPQSDTQGPLSPGDYSFDAKYLSGNDENYSDSDVSDCEPFTVNKAQLTAATKVHDASHADITGSSVALGSVVHDTAKLSGVVAGYTPAAITFAFYSQADCGGSPVAVANTGADQGDATADRSAASAALGAGSYSFKASVAGDANYLGDDSDCENFTVNKAQLTATTKVHDASHSDITNGSVALGSVVHDTAKLSGVVAGKTPAAITFAFYSQADCAGSPTAVANTGADEGDATAARSAASAALDAGSYSYKASVADNANYLGDSSDCENFSVGKAQLTVATKVHDASHSDITNGSVALGSIVHDTAKLSGVVAGKTPAAITFAFYSQADCAGSPTAVANTGADQGDATADRSAASAALGAGSYSFKASVAGDANYLGDDSDCENFSVGKAQLTVATKVHDASHSDITNGSVALGSVVHDTAKLSGVVAGKTPAAITFAFYSQADCAGSPTAVANTGADEGDATAARSAASAALDAGSYSYKASVADNADYVGDSSDCENFSVGKAQLTVATKVHDASHTDITNGSVALGSVVHDTAKLSGVVAGKTPAAITFAFYAQADCAGDAVAVANTGADEGDATADRSAASAALGAGSYSYKASVADNANYVGDSSDCENFSIGKAQLTVATKVHDSSHNDITGSSVPVSSIVHDTAKLSGVVAGKTPAAITFAFYSQADCAGDAVAVANTGADEGDATADRSAASAALGAGSYSYKASVAGDANYLGDSSDCENFTVNKAQPSILTTQDPASGSVGDTYNDTATLSDGVMLDGTGSITFTLYDAAGCDGNVIDTETVHNISANGDYSTPTGVKLDSAGTYYWVASFNGDSNNLSADSGCDDEPVVVKPAAIHIVKTPDAAQVNAGEQIGFTLTVYNDGAGDAHGVTLTDTLPVKAGLDWSIASQGLGWDDSCSIDAGGVLTCGGQSGVTVPAGTSQEESTFTVHITSPTTAATGGVCPEGSGVIDNTGDVTTTNDGSDESTASTCVAAPAIHIVKTADAAQVNVGDPIGFTLTVYNTGSGDAHGVMLSDTLPPNAGLSWSIASQGVGWNGSCAIAAGKLTCGGANGVTVKAGTTQAASTFTVHITSPTTGATGGDCPETGVVDNTGSVTTTNDGTDESSASTCVQAMVDLSVTKSGSPATQTLGDGNITWTMVVTNNGPSEATGVTIADPMPAGNTFVSATTTQGSCTGGAILNCTIGAMAAGASVTITLVTTPSTVGAQTNTVTVAGSRPETNTGNNSATATVQTVGVITPPEFCVAVSKVTPKQLFVGRKTKLTIHVTQDKKAVKGIHVRIKGPKVNIKTGASNSKGVIKQTIKMKKAGILVFTPIASKRCNTKRVGVTNVFTPPVTG